MKWFSRIRDKLTAEANSWYKLWSSWLAVLWGVIVTVLWNDPLILGQIVSVLPSETRAYLSPVILGIVAALPIVVRLLKQQKLTNSGHTADGRSPDSEVR